MSGEVYHPNRELPESKQTRVIVVFLLTISVAVMALITIAGWNELAGAQIVQFGYILIYAAFVILVARWNKGSLALATALGLILIIFALVAGPGWFARDKSGFEEPLLPETVMGILTLCLVPIQVFLIAFALRGFRQNWNVEELRP